jgi:hypothetical protein
MRLLTAPPLRRLVAGTWSLYWNGLADGAAPRPSARGAALVQDLAWRLASRRQGRGPGAPLQFPEADQEGRSPDDRAAARPR